MPDVQTLLDNPEHDPRYPLYAHLYDVHGWRGLAAFNYASQAEPGSPCPECGDRNYVAAA